MWNVTYINVAVTFIYSILCNLRGITIAKHIRMTYAVQRRTGPKECMNIL